MKSVELTVEDIEDIKQKRSLGISLLKIAEEYKTNFYRIKEICKDTLPPKHRFHNKKDKQYIEDRVIKRADGCWDWQGGKIKGGYGILKIEGEHYLAHRLAYELWNGPIPIDPNTNEPYFCCHSCDRPCCVAPNHLWIGDHNDNMKDMWNKGRNYITIGELNGHAELATKDIIEIFDKFCNQGYTQLRLAKEYNIEQGHVSAILRRELWPHIDSSMFDVEEAKKRNHLRGEDSCWAVLNEEKVKEIKIKAHSQQYTRKSLSKEYGVTPMTILGSLRGEYWAHVYIPKIDEDLRAANPYGPPKVLLTREIVLAVKEKLATKQFTIKQVAIDFGITYDQARGISRNKYYKDIV